MNTNSPDQAGQDTSFVLTPPAEELPGPSEGADSTQGSSDPVPPGQADLFADDRTAG
jgi:hypothetical protein